MARFVICRGPTDRTNYNVVWSPQVRVMWREHAMQTRAELDAAMNNQRQRPTYFKDVGMSLLVIDLTFHYTILIQTDCSQDVKCRLISRLNPIED